MADRQEKELIILGILESERSGVETTDHGKKKTESDRLNRSFEDVKICLGVLRFIYSLGQKQMKNLPKHLEENGPAPQVHGNKGRKAQAYCTKLCRS